VYTLSHVNVGESLSGIVSWTRSGWQTKFCTSTDHSNTQCSNHHNLADTNVQPVWIQLTRARLWAEQQVDPDAVSNDILESTLLCLIASFLVVERHVVKAAT
jgi:UV DNA damage repair endonuclease